MSKIKEFLWDLVPNSGLRKLRHSQLLSITPHVDLVVNKTRRRRSSLLTTPIRQSTSHGCLLQVANNFVTLTRDQ